MPPLQKQLVGIDFGAGVEQKEGVKHILPGKLVVADNVRQTKSKTYRKREGFSAMAKTAQYDDTGNSTDNLDYGYGLASSGGELVLRSRDLAHTYSDDDSKWMFRGHVARTAITEKQMLPAMGKIPTMVWESALNRAWMFGIGTDGLLYLSVYDHDTGEILLPPSKQPGPAANTIRQMRTFMYTTGGGARVILLLTYTTSNTILSYKFTCASWDTYGQESTITAAETVFAPTGGTIRGIDVAPGGANGHVLLAYGDNLVSGGAPFSNFVMFLGLTDGLYNSGVGRIGMNGVAGSVSYFSTLAKNATATQVWALSAEMSGGTMRWYALKINPTTLALVSTTMAWNTGSGAPADWKLTAVCWGVSTTGVHAIANAAEPTNIEDMVLGAIGTTASYDTNFLRASWLASDIFTIGSYNYVIVGHYDDENHLQSSYTMYRLTGLNGSSSSSFLQKEPVARMLYGRGGQFHFQPKSGTSWVNLTQGAAAVSVVGNKVYVGLQEWSTADVYAGTFVEVDTSASLGPLCRDGDDIIFPGAWPQRYTGGRLMEMSPSMWPRSIVTTDPVGGSLSAGSYSTAVCYVLKTADGRVIRSAPSPTYTSATVALNDKLTVAYPNLRFFARHPWAGVAETTTAAKVYIEIYCTRLNDTVLRLKGVVLNDPTADTSTYDITTQPSTTDEVIYTQGGALDNAPVPPFRVAFTWRGRLFLTGTDVAGETWFSQEEVTGRGREFNELLTFKVPGGRIYAGGAVDDNYAVLFQRERVWLLSGAGPDPLGNGNYTPALLPIDMGSTCPHVVTTPLGLLYQGLDGGIYLIARDTTQSYVGRGIDDGKTLTVVAMVHHANAQHARIHMSDGTVYVFDYGNPTAEAPFQWYRWTGLTAATGATVLNDVHYFVTSDGTVYKQVAGQYFDGSSTAILPKIKTAPIRFAGIQGLQRVYRGQALGSYVSAHTVKITLDEDDGQVSQNSSKAMSAGPWELEFRPSAQKCGDMQVTVEQTGTDTGEGFSFDAVAFEIGVKPGMKRLSTTQRI